jgi:RimJ/RimL family protein N-acetyltransferase
MDLDAVELRPVREPDRKVGFREEGVLRGAEFRDGTWRDAVVFGLLRGEQADT